MRFTLSSEQRQFAASIGELLAAADVPTAVYAWGDGNHGPGLKIWRSLADLGVTGLVVPSRFGGLDATPVDLAVAFERLGYHAVPGPWVESAAAVPALLGETEAAERLLPGIAEGEVLASVVLPPHVPYGLDADVAGCRILAHGGTVREFTAGAVMSSVDKARRLFPASPGPVVATGTDVGRALDSAALAIAAQLVGAGRWLLDTSVAYAKQRSQYGKPIGQYQAVKHLLADIATRLELATPLVHGAAVTLAGGPAPRDVSAARVAAADAAYLAARTALQVHGAIGYAEEHPLGLWLTKVRALVAAWGTQSFHRGRVLAAVAA
ncbi:hypothetical protein SAMN05216266_112129 [Amycolatopsis marina]|uniref:Acyl-CoA dehydrogenase n=1 Tax=Amycolatopsis marina TaxID=490629 RepID=A0A1I1BB98_9PSEU|nr:acyl-CoA dehydrogenase family protein [Amycolatopsis marina]SFB45978.1 hypothetical protein SAMN05216266_112129 [Amycolatopsis marina]